MKAYLPNQRTLPVNAQSLTTQIKSAGVINRFACYLAEAAVLLLLASLVTLGKDTFGLDAAKPRLDTTCISLPARDYLIPTLSLDTLERPSHSQRISAPCPSQPDYAALEDLFNATHGSAWNNKTNWLTDCNPCSWYGISCLNGRVDGIDLRFNHLVGTFPTSLSALTQLRSLYVDGNQLSGPIPASVTALTKLQAFSGNFNQLTGSIPPNIGNLTQLQGLYLSNNQLTGSIPTSLTALSNLGGLNLGVNQLSGPLPTSLGNLTKLQNINLTANQLSGSLPVSLIRLTNLQYLSLGSNQLSGTLPTSLSALTQLRGLYLSGNRFSGPLPSSLGLLPNLLELYLGANQFTGLIPASLGSLTKLIALDLSYNQLSGAIPSSLGSLINISTLDVSHNQLNGCFPSSLSTLCGSWRTVNFSGNAGLPNQGDFARFCADGSGGCNRLPDLIPMLYVRPSIVYNSTTLTLVMDVVELNSVATTGSFTVKVTKNTNITLSFPASATLINNRSVQNSVWTFNEADPNYYVLSTSQRIEAGSKLSFGLTGTLNPGATGGVLAISSVVLPGTITEASQSNNSDTEKIEYFQ